MGGVNPVGRKGYETWNMEKVDELPPIKRGGGAVSYRQEILEKLQENAPKHPGQWYRVFESPSGNPRSASAMASKLKNDLGPRWEVASREAAIYARFVGRQRKRPRRKGGTTKKAA